MLRALKIETREGFENLPAVLLAAMRSRAVGVMIARGDLAIECGYRRLAEVQEEILWICEAAHMPVIWATQVLESLAKTGVPSRSKITDAAMGERAECVMLNEGPYPHICYRRAPSRRHFAPHAIASGKDTLHAAQTPRRHCLSRRCPLSVTLASDASPHSVSAVTRNRDTGHGERGWE
ncbi:MAG: pyruvate kinase [Candidatus Acidiferrales bacterium]